MSNWDAASEISRFNASSATGEVKVSPELATLMAAAQDVHDASLGRFDTTIGPLIEAWGFGADGTRPHHPGAETLAAAAARSGHDNTLRIAPGALQKRQAGTQVYLAAIGKGYGADRVGRALSEMGVTDYLIEIGGDLYAAGRNADGLPWQIGVETPDSRTRGVMQVVGLSDKGLASSGDYRNYFEEDGTRFSHVIDPVTGAPITHRTASATVMAENGMLADAWATAMLTLGSEAGMDVAVAHDIAVLFIDRDGDGFVTTPSPRFAALQA
jgi:thiamine biosynthesis lipoprotein